MPKVLEPSRLKHRKRWRIFRSFRSDRIHKIFDSFTQADRSTTRQFGGTGLGLPITKKLVELMGGELKVESEENIGSTFSFSLHLPKGSELEKSAPEIPATVSARSERGQKRILIAEDNGVNVRIAEVSEFSKPVPTFDFADLPTLDFSRLREVTGNDEFLISEILNEFVELTPIQISSLRESLESEDFPTAKRAAHTIKGSSAAIGAEKLREVALKIENVISSNELGLAWSMVPELDREFGDVARAIKTGELGR